MIKRKDCFRVKYTCLFLSIFLSLVSPVLAFDPLDVYQPEKDACSMELPKENISLPLAMEYAVCQNPRLKAGYLSTQVSSAQYGQSLSSYMPDISGSARLSHSGSKKDGFSSEDSSNSSLSLSLNWLVFDFGGRTATSDKFELYLKSALSTYDNSLQSLLYSVADTYWAVLSAEEKYEGLQESEKSYQKSFEEANSRYELGLVPLSDKLQAETAYKQAQLASNVARKNIALQRGNLANLLNLPPYTHFKLVRPSKKITDKDDVGKIENLIKTALEQRPDFKAATQKKEASLQDVRIAKSEWMPSISASASGSIDNRFNHGGETTYSGSAGLTLSLPIFSGFSQSYKIGQAEYAYQQASQELIDTKNAIENEVWSAVQDYKTSLESFQISKTLLSSAKENERVAFASYKVGKVNIITLLDAQSSLAEARIEHSTSFYNFLTAKSNLSKALGQMEIAK